MLATSQLLRLSQILCGKFPEGLSLSLLDRAESLGENVMQLVEQAKAQNRTILATIVGNKPAEIPADVGVWVVTGGRVEQ